MRRRRLAAAVALTLVALAAAACSSDDGATADPRPTTTSTTEPPTTTTTTRPADLAAAAVTLTPVAPAEAATVIATRAGDSSLYFAEQRGRILAIVDGAAAPSPVLDLTDLVTAGGEQGFLGLAFSPDGNHLYAHYSGQAGETTVDEYAFTAAPGGGGTADPATRRTLLTVPQPQPNHNGGQLAFGPDDALYLGLGDGGAAGDRGTGHAPGGNAQSLDTLLGKIVRFDPASGAAEIFALGLRNPWRFSFDRATGDVWIGDVGQDAWEEIDRLPFAQARGANFGWPLLEGTHAFDADAAPGTVAPTFEISQNTGACAVVGGYVYRGTKIPDLVGSYLYTDNCNGSVHALKLDADGAVALERDLGISLPGPTSFGEGDDGELYIASGSEGIFRIDPA